MIDLPIKDSDVLQKSELESKPEKDENLKIEHHIWRQIGLQFSKSKQALIQKLKNLSINNEFNKIITESQIFEKSVEEVLNQLQQIFKYRLSKMIFNNLVAQKDNINLKMRLQQIEAIHLFQQKQTQKKVKVILKEQQQLKTLTKSYERFLINKKENQPNLNSVKSQKVNDKTHIQRPKGQLNIFQVFSFKISCHQSKADKQNVFSNQKMKLSQMSRGLCQNNIDRSALRELQQKWNKSINLSSKNITSNKKLLNQTDQMMKQSENQKNNNKNRPYVNRRRKSQHQNFQKNDFLSTSTLMKSNEKGNLPSIRKRDKSNETIVTQFSYQYN